jgi:hypothetical protein
MKELHVLVEFENARTTTAIPFTLITRESGKLHKSHTNQLLAIP